MYKIKIKKKIKKQLPQHDLRLEGWQTQLFQLLHHVLKLSSHQVKEGKRETVQNQNKEQDQETRLPQHDLRLEGWQT